MSESDRCTYIWVPEMFCHTHQCYLKPGDEPDPCPVSYLTKKLSEETEARMLAEKKVELIQKAVRAYTHRDE